MSRRGFSLILLGLVAGCGTTATGHVYKLYPGPQLPDAELATVSFGSREIFNYPMNVERVLIDGVTADRTQFGKVKVLPGNHEIVFPSQSGSRVIHVSVTLEPGHNYVLMGWGGPVRVSGQWVNRWIQDAETGDIVGEVRSP